MNNINQQQQIEDDDEEIAFLDVRMFKSGKCVIELQNNTKLSKLVAAAIIQDDELFDFFANILMNYQLGVNNKNNK